MRLPVLFVPLMTLALGAQAQQAYKYNAPVKQYSPYVRQALAKHLKTAQKTTAVHERVIGSSIYVFDGSGLSLQDSTDFVYSNGRGSQFDPNIFFIEEDSIQFDSTTHFVDNGQGFEFERANTATYDNANRRTSIVELRDGVTSNRENFRDRRFTYDANGNVSIVYVLGWNLSTSKWDTLTRRHYAYNGQNQVIADSIYSYSSSDFISKNEYSLDGNGNQVELALYTRQSGSWVPQFLSKHTYDALNNITTNFTQNYDVSIPDWVNSTFDTFAYNNNHVYHFTESQNWNTGTNSWDNTSRELRTLNSAGDRVVTQDVKNWDAQTGTWEDEAVIDWTYTSMGNPMLGLISIDLGGTPFEVGNINFFYEQYHDLHIADTKANTNALSAYPNPATNVINLEWKQPVSGVKISLANMMGQKVYQTNNAIDGSSATLQVDLLPAGTYLLTVTNNTGAVLETKTVVKQ